MDPLTRRRFLLASGVVAGAALAAGGTTITLAELLGTAKHHDNDPNASRLVVITLYGGNDGLNTVVPYADPHYQDGRRYLAYEPEQVQHLDSKLGLNPMLTGLRRLWNENHLAIVLGVGYPKPDRSHFRSMDIWQSGSPSAPVHTGWIGRWLDAVGGAPETAVSFEPILPPLLAGATRAGACVSPNGLKLPPGLTETMVAALGHGAAGEPAMQTRVATSLDDLLQVSGVVRKARSMNIPRLIDGVPLPDVTAGGEPTLTNQLNLIARCVEAGVATRVYSASLSGFDTHADERGTQERMLKQLDQALAAFVERLAKTDAGRRVVVLVYSEFGRRVRANASQGTDHGTAGPVFVLGPTVRGGFVGEQPSLTDLDDGDLKATGDFRDVYGTLLEAVLDADPARFLEGYRYRRLPLIAGLD